MAIKMLSHSDFTPLDEALQTMAINTHLLSGTGLSKVVKIRASITGWWF